MTARPAAVLDQNRMDVKSRFDMLVCPFAPPLSSAGRHETSWSVAVQKSDVAVRKGSGQSWCYALVVQNDV